MKDKHWLCGFRLAHWRTFNLGVYAICVEADVTEVMMMARFLYVSVKGRYSSSRMSDNGPNTCGFIINQLIVFGRVDTLFIVFQIYMKTNSKYCVGLE